MFWCEYYEYDPKKFSVSIWTRIGSFSRHSRSSERWLETTCHRDRHVTMNIPCWNKVDRFFSLLSVRSRCIFFRRMFVLNASFKVWSPIRSSCTFPSRTVYWNSWKGLQHRSSSSVTLTFFLSVFFPTMLSKRFSAMCWTFTIPIWHGIVPAERLDDQLAGALLSIAIHCDSLSLLISRIKPDRDKSLDLFRFVYGELLRKEAGKTQLIKYSNYTRRTSNGGYAYFLTTVE